MKSEPTKSPSAEVEARLLDRLRDRAATWSCGEFLLGIGALQRCEIYTSLVFDRLQRKIETVEKLHAEANENWNQTFYLLYFRTLGDSANRDAFLELARRVPYRVLQRERLAPHAIEAMLVGASGLASLYPRDGYMLTLERLFEHLSAKYEITPMEPSAWELAEIRPANHPILRIAQAAEFFAQDEFIVERVMACRTEEDVRRLFSIEASEYWRTHYVPGCESDERPKRIGRFKANIIGINLVAILQFAYGSYTGRESLRDNALSLLERLPAEDNRYMRAWQNASGLEIRDAFESQALLQLATEYCPAKRCAECPVGRRILWRATHPAKQ